MPVAYPPPLDQLLTLGAPSPDVEWLDYRALGLGEEHVPALVALAQDPALEWAVHREGDDETPFWAPLHAWRALGQLRAPDAAGPMVGELLRDLDNDWVSADLPVALAMIGPEALRPLHDGLPSAARAQEALVVRDLGAALVKIAAAHPQVRDEVVALLTRQLQVGSEQDEEVNAFLVSALLDLRAVEAVPVMQEAFEAAAVDTFVAGDWEDVQVELGLLAERTTPRRRFGLGPAPAFRDHEPAHALPARRGAKAAAKTRNRRKIAKQSRKKNRRRR